MVLLIRVLPLVLSARLLRIRQHWLAGLAWSRFRVPGFGITLKTLVRSSGKIITLCYARYGSGLGSPLPVAAHYLHRTRGPCSRGPASAEGPGRQPTKPRGSTSGMLRGSVPSEPRGQRRSRKDPAASGS